MQGQSRIGTDNERWPLHGYSIVGMGVLGTFLHCDNKFVDCELSPLQMVCVWCQSLQNLSSMDMYLKQIPIL